MRRLIQAPEYKALKLLALDVAKIYREYPGTTRGEDESYLTHCKVLWAYNTLWKKVEQLAHLEHRQEEKNNHKEW